MEQTVATQSRNCSPRDLRPTLCSAKLSRPVRAQPSRPALTHAGPLTHTTRPQTEPAYTRAHTNKHGALLMYTQKPRLQSPLRIGLGSALQ